MCVVSHFRPSKSVLDGRVFFKKNLFLGRVFLKFGPLIIEINGPNEGQHTSWLRVIFFGLQTSLIFLIVFFKRERCTHRWNIISLCLAMLVVYEMRWDERSVRLICDVGEGCVWVWWVGVQAQEMRDVVFITIGQCQQNPSDQITHQTIPYESFPPGPSLFKLQILIPKLTYFHIIYCSYLLIQVVHFFLKGFLRLSRKK